MWWPRRAVIQALPQSALTCDHSTKYVGIGANVEDNLLQRCVTGAMGDITPASSDSDTDKIALGGLELIAEVGALFRRSMMGWLVVIALLVMLS